MYMRRPLLFLLPLLLTLFSCATEHSKIVVAEFDSKEIMMGEFENAYAKNFGGPENVKKDSTDALKKFLDLYVNYEMKLRDAVVRGYTADPDIQREIIDYKANIGSTLLLQNKLYEPRLKELYERRKWEIHAAHIFFTPDSARNEQQNIEFAKQLIDSLKAGKNFAEMAKKYSKDNYTKTNGGDVYFVTAGQIVSSALEDAVYNTEVGQIYPEPVKSPLGIHIIKVLEKQLRRPSIRAQHILVALRDSAGQTLDTAAAYSKILDIKKRLDAGEDFGKLAKELSADKASAAKNGDLNFFTRGRMVREFDEAAFKLKVGEVSPIVKSNYGYHIIKVTDEKSIPPYEEEKKSLKDMYDRYRYKEDYGKLISDLKKEFNLKRDESSINKITSRFDTLTIGNSYWGSDLQKELGSLTVFIIKNRPYIADSLFQSMQRMRNYNNRKLDIKIFNNVLDQYEGEVVIREKGMNFDKENEEFAKLMEEYENGVYLFKILEEEVWSKITVDSQKVMNYWEKTKDNYIWKDRVEFREIYVNNDSTANVVYSLAQSNKDFDSLVTVHTKRTDYEKTPGYKGLVEFDNSDLAKIASSLKNVGDITKPLPFQNGWSIVKLVNRERTRVKTFEEAKAEVASIVQESESKRLEEEYINKLKNTYNPKYYYDELSKAFER